MYNSKSSEGKKLIHDAHEYYPSLIDPTNVDEIVDAIVYMLDHSEEVKMTSENERIAMKASIFFQLFTVPNKYFVQEFLQIYKTFFIK